MVILLMLFTPWALATPSIIITKTNENICLKADQAPIVDIAEALEGECGITLHGTEWLKGEFITLNVCESMESLLRRICRSIPQKSHSLVFEGEKLVAVYFLPGSGQSFTAIGSHKDFTRKTAQPKEVSVARVDKLMTGPAVSPLWEFQTDDVILSYNGKRITRGPLELVDVMKKTNDYEQIEIEIGRDNVIRKVLVPGGMLNISTVTQRISTNTPGPSEPYQ